MTNAWDGRWLSTFAQGVGYLGVAVGGLSVALLLFGGLIISHGSSGVEYQRGIDVLLGQPSHNERLLFLYGISLAVVLMGGLLSIRKDSPWILAALSVLLLAFGYYGRMSIGIPFLVVGGLFGISAIGGWIGGQRGHLHG